MSIHEYFDKVTQTIMAFQYLEVLLKMYIRDCDTIIQKSVKESFHYSVREKEIDKMPLGRLIEEFSRRSNRKDYVSGMKKLNRFRNHFAHTAYLLNIEEQNDSTKLKEQADKAERVRKAVVGCMKDIGREHSRVTGQPFNEEDFDKM